MTGRVIVVGDVVTDLVAVLAAPIASGSDTPARISAYGGGAGGNIAAWLVRAGVPVTLCGVVGADAAGSFQVDELAAAGVTCAVRQCPDAATGSVIVLSGAIEPDGSAGRTMITDRGANALLGPDDVDAAVASAPDAVHLHLSGYTLLDAGSSDAGRRALDAAVERGLTVSVDAASAEPLRHVGGPAFMSLVRRADVLFANVAEARVLLGDGSDGGETLGATDLAAALAMRLEGRTDVGGTVVVKLGASGAVAATSRGAVLPMAALAVDVRDTTGAGDAFAAGFLGAWLTGAEVGDALKAGTAFGALAVTMVGARPTA